MATKDCNGNVLNDGDSGHLIKDLKVKGANATLKPGWPHCNGQEHSIQSGRFLRGQVTGRQRRGPRSTAS